MVYSRGYGWQIINYASSWPANTRYPQNIVQTSSSSRERSLVRLRQSSHSLLSPIHSARAVHYSQSPLGSCKYSPPQHDQQRRNSSLASLLLLPTSCTRHSSTFYVLRPRHQFWHRAYFTRREGFCSNYPFSLSPSPYSLFFAGFILISLFLYKFFVACNFMFNVLVQLIFFLIRFESLFFCLA